MDPRRVSPSGDDGPSTSRSDRLSTSHHSSIASTSRPFVWITSPMTSEKIAKMKDEQERMVYYVLDREDQAPVRTTYDELDCWYRKGWLHSDYQIGIILDEREVQNLRCWYTLDELLAMNERHMPFVFWNCTHEELLELGEERLRNSEAFKKAMGRIDKMMEDLSWMRKRLKELEKKKAEKDMTMPCRTVNNNLAVTGAMDGIPKDALVPPSNLDPFEILRPYQEREGVMRGNVEKTMRNIGIALTGCDIDELVRRTKHLFDADRSHEKAQKGRFCAYCNKWVNAVKQMFEHLSSDNHINAIRRCSVSYRAFKWWMGAIQSCPVKMRIRLSNDSNENIGNNNTSRSVEVSGNLIRGKPVFRGRGGGSVRGADRGGRGRGRGG